MKCFYAYSFSFNGQERDDEVAGVGNAYDFGARIYDARLGKWFSIDPLAVKQPDWSPYKAFLDNPIVWIDQFGETEKERITAVNTAKAQIGTPYSELDCSSLAEKSARSAGIKGLKSGNGIDGCTNGVAVIAGNSRKININNATVGNFLTFKSGRSDHKGPNGKYDHIGIISEVIRDKKNNIIGYKVIHATSSNGTMEQSVLLADGGMPGFELREAFEWDTEGEEDEYKGPSLISILMRKPETTKFKNSPSFGKKPKDLETKSEAKFNKNDAKFVAPGPDSDADFEAPDELKS